MSTVVLNTKVVPIYEHIANADHYALARITKVLAGEITSTEINGLDFAERRLLLKACEIRRRELSRESAEAGVMDTINTRFAGVQR